MAKGMYIGDADGKARKVKKVYIGVDGIARRIKKAYIGDADGKARLFYTGLADPGEVIFTSSQTWTVPEGVESIDVFLVGGGASGAWCGVDSDVTSVGGGGGGFTETYTDIPVTPGDSITVVIGAGGAAISKPTSDYSAYPPNAGGSTYFGSYSASGGLSTRTGESVGNRGSDGGSGGGYGAKGGEDGSDGSGTYAGSGQGSTTRAWGDPNGTLYAGGGGGAYANRYYGSDWTDACYGSAGGAGGGGKGGASNLTTDLDDNDSYGSTGAAESGTANTGGGGGGYRHNGKSGYNHPSGAGGSGICIVRWGY